VTASLQELLARALPALYADEEALRAHELAELGELEAVERAARERRLRRSGASCSPEMREAIVSGSLDLEATRSARTVDRWLRSGHAFPTLVLSGGGGCGKSTAAAWALAQSASGGTVRSATAVARAWLSTTNRAGDEQDAMCIASLLVLDDVGTELGHQVEAMGAALRELLETRQHLRTIITTNLTKSAWAERYPDARIASRMQRAAWVVDDGADLRRRQP
jgi:DNA replication protein DnaC